MDVLKASPVGNIERGIALVIDLIITFTIALSLNLAFFHEIAISFLGIATGFSYFYAVFLPLFWNGYTIGKRIVGIRIANVSGEKLTMGTMVIREILVRNLLYYIAFGILTFVSIYLISTRNDKRSIHDLLSGTYVTSNLPE
ncbi:RDD family protein [Salipaludibacillus sp. HK11]|uniref:RDD family protein n=1 Tax=Salipaludibacillus sp. HK11 TaxID=3394320 RepID=UPI0039FCD8F4